MANLERAIIAMKYLQQFWILIIAGLSVIVLIIAAFPGLHNRIAYTPNKAVPFESGEWRAPDINLLPASEDSEVIRYGRELIVNTARYFGPKGSVSSVSNGMNCQNCHIDAGLRPYSNCLSAVAATYPAFRPRSGKIESIEFRINDCFQRSLNGKSIDSISNEMKAMVAFLKWVGNGVKKGVRPKGAGSEELPFMERAANPLKGEALYKTKCQSCHGTKGEGFLKPDSSAFIYPPLWGPNSYNTGAGLYRLTKFAGYIKNSMPFGATYYSPLLTNEESWDIAAYVNTQPRPEKIFPEDWPVLFMKSIDFPFGPYTDTFSESQHKYGPFAPIKKAYAILNRR
jgi:thiosulfate dehydrogenase